MKNLNKLLITTPIDNDELNLIKNLGYHVSICLEREKSFKKSVLKFTDINCMICLNPFPFLNLSNFSNINWIQLTSSNFNHVPLKYISDNKITFTNNRGAFDVPVSEWIILRILESYKNSFKIYENQKKRKWHTDYSVKEIYGSTIGFLGTGNIAKETAKRLKPFGVKLIGLNRSGSLVDFFDKLYSKDMILKFLKLCDVIILTLPSNSETHKIANEAFFNMLKNGSTFINISRGDLIEEISLIKAINEKKVSYVALDVFEEEPLPSKSKLWDFDEILISSHNAWVSQNYKKRKFINIFQNLKNYSKNTPLINLVSKS